MISFNFWKLERRVLFHSVSALLKKGSPIYRKTSTYRAFHAFSEYVFQYVLLFPLFLKYSVTLERVSFQNCKQS